MKDFSQHIIQFILDNGLPQNDKKLLVAVSGGADSVALLRVLLQLGYPVVVAHCDFHLRGHESLRDERFVRGLCQQLGVSLLVHDFDVASYCQQHGVSVEMACRELRYAWFEQELGRQACEAVAVAHHRDDNIETFFLNALRGTGIAGLAGMRPRNGHVIRPLLGVSRSDILHYLSVLSQPYVTDSTNLQCDVKRNRLRNVVLPALYGQFSEAPGTLAATVAHASQGNALYQEMVAQLGQVWLVPQPYGWSVNWRRLTAQFANAAMLLFEWLRPHGFNAVQIHELLQVLRAGQGTGRTFSSSSATLTVNRDNLELSLDEAKVQDNMSVKLCDSVLQNPFKCAIHRDDVVPFSPSLVDGRWVVAFNSQLQTCRDLRLRHWRQGDRFRPFGMRGTRLLSDLFTDLKLTARQKRQVWLLEADGQILWVVGFRAADAFRVASGSTGYWLFSAARF